MPAVTASNPPVTFPDPVEAIPGLTMPPPEFMVPAFTYQDEFNIEGDNDLPPISAYINEIDDPDAVPAEPEAPPVTSAPPSSRATDDRATTLSSVLIAFTPWLAAASIGAALVLRGFELTAWWFWVSVALPWLLTLLLAAIDRARLRRWGYGYPASWAWALLSAPVYLIARTRAVRQESDHGIAPMWLWITNVALVAAAGTALGMFGGVFAVPALAEQIETDIEAELLGGGEVFAVDCPIVFHGAPSFLGTPSGESMSCAATTPATITNVIDPAWISDFIEPARVAAVYFERGIEYSFVVKSVR